MLGWEQVSRQLIGIIRAGVGFAQARKREEATIALAAVLVWVGYYFPTWLAPEFKQWINSWHGLVIVPGVLYASGAILLAYGAYRVWLLVRSPDLPPPRDLPSAIKGPLAFTPSDGDLFRRLGREESLRKLLGLIEDDQIRLVIVTGRSGVGKTSLVRAGLTDILKDKNIQYHYWEAVPTSSSQSLLRAVQDSWQSVPVTSNTSSDLTSTISNRPKSLDDLVNPSAGLRIQKQVIVLDQFEQLDGSGNGPIHRLLRKVALEAKPPHHVTWIVVFRQEFRGEWEEFTLPQRERGIYPAEVFLRPFTVTQARDVISQLIAETEMSVHQTVVNNLVNAVSVDGEVSPVDIGIGLQVLADLHERNAKNTVTLKDYYFAGGAEGVLTHYISTCLEMFSKPDQETVLKAVLALRDPGSNQRIAAGRTCVELAKEIRTDPGRLKIHLDRLTQRDARLLEVAVPRVNGEIRYRLPHERLIPALRRIAGQLLADVDRIRIRFENAFTAWRNSDKNRSYLLKSKELRCVERYESQIPWGKNESEKRDFLRSSQRQRTRRHLILAAMLIIISAVGWQATSQYKRYEARKFLTNHNYPPELFDWQNQLRVLKLNEPISVQGLPWLNSGTLEELTLYVSEHANSLEGLTSLANCRSLKKLTLSLQTSEVTDLTPLTRLQQLTHLDLTLGSNQVRDLTPLTNLPSLTHLSLRIYGNDVRDLKALANLSPTIQLTLTLDSGMVSEVAQLAKLPLNTQLTFDITSGNVSDLASLAKFPMKVQLHRDVTLRIADLEPLMNLPANAELDLVMFAGGPGWNLPALTKLSALTRLELIYLDNMATESKIEDLTPLTQLPSLTHLTLRLSSTSIDSLVPLILLTSKTLLTIKFVGNSIPDLTWLAAIHPNTEVEFSLPLGASQSPDLKSLIDSHINTEISFQPISTEIPDVSKFSGIPSNIKLSFYFRKDGEVSNLKPLSKLSAITRLELSLSESKVTDLTPLAGLDSCQSLILHVNTNQRMSLKTIPRSVTHLEF